MCSISSMSVISLKESIQVNILRIEINMTSRNSKNYSDVYRISVDDDKFERWPFFRLELDSSSGGVLIQRIYRMGKAYVPPMAEVGYMSLRKRAA